ncbi:MAG: hypothetical protein GTO45_07115, partial [Candidatus Aminicenantes bacterium]|nr:hypothetical protein [Candidatus Aminicenantes bacterium]NIM78612.1 hypothetical protein [Candidatus Aminicenantes bacterium]NIN17857.1 hypothetical protein [Candidatus Aminicenantes bacterium]NIN41761.1 hypothetical protein [Candidatus Aminicenantes bacterium]NIN84510.1 hypothetical protein [Candidatus Aminicenantes bacterium]
MQKGNGKKMNLLMSVVFILCFCFASCMPGARNTETGNSEHFHKIYDPDDAFNYTAVDIKPTQAGGYIILAEVDEHPYLLNVDEKGDFLWATDPNAFDDYINPISNLLIFNDNYYFFCNKISGTISLPILLKYSESNGTHEEVTFADDLFVVEGADVDDRNRTIFPLHASKTLDDKILLLAFDEPNGRILLRIMDFQGVRILKEKHDNYFQDICRVEYPLQDKRLHFTGLNKYGNNFYYFQSFCKKNLYEKENVCFRFVTVKPEDGEYIDIFPVKKPLIAVEWHSSKQFSAARIDDNVISFYVNSDSNKMDMDEKEGHPQYESIEAKPVYIETIPVNGREVVFFASTTKTSKIVLAVFDHSNGECLYNYYIGNVYPYEAAGLIG